MVAKFFLITSFVFSNLLSLGQENFSLSDATFEIGQTYIIRNIRFDLNHGHIILDSTTKLTLDSITDFFKNNKGFNFEIGMHTDWRASENYNLKLSDRRAKMLRRFFCSKGVHEKQLTSKGYGETELIHSQEEMEINPELDQESIDKMHWENRRVVLKVTSQASPFQYTFSLSDSIFEIGETFTTYGIRFELNKPDLIVDEITEPLLDSLVSFFKDHPEMGMELGVHTDSRGRQDRSFVLSEVRARFMYSYFVERGVGKLQIVPVGYEAAKPIHFDSYINHFKEKNPQEYHRLHQENRRVVLTILKTE